MQNDKIKRNDPCPCGSKLKYKKCCAKRDQDKADIEAEGRMVPLATGIYRHEGKGRRDYVFTPLPKELKDPAQVCGRWVTDELCSRGMFCELVLWRTDTGQPAPMFSCSIFEVTKDGFGDEIEEWATDEFFEHLKNSFSKAINDALEQSGLPRFYEIIDDYVAGQNISLANSHIERDPITGIVTYEQWYSDGVPDRADGPALIERDPVTGAVIYEEWWKDGQMHRAAGPALIQRNPVTGIVTYEEWWKDGKQVSQH